MTAPAIAPLIAADHDPWLGLAHGYKDFYRDPIPDEEYEQTWAKLIGAGPIHGLAARVDGEMVGFAHYLFHAHSWTGEVCYLQDLFTRPDMRGRGVARALIDAVADSARARGATRFYWLTKEDNREARALYDRIAAFKGFIRYDYML